MSTGCVASPSCFTGMLQEMQRRGFEQVNVLCFLLHLNINYKEKHALNLAKEILAIRFVSWFSCIHCFMVFLHSMFVSS